MKRTRWSLFYVAGYLLSGGLGLLLAPELALRLMFSNGSYGDVLPRLVGVLTVGLAIIVIQIIRKRLAALYATLIGVRVLFVACYAAFYAKSGDPFFLSLGGIVGFGLLASSTCYLLERGRPA